MPAATHIFLIGFSGSGKSSVGPILAKRLKARFVDIDSRIEKKARCSITEIFEKRGEPAFRRLEERAVRTSLKQVRRRMVLALGGGAYENVRIRKLAKAYGTVVYLSCSRREIYRRMRAKTDRPLLQGRSAKRETLVSQIAQLLERRLPRYRTADLTVSTTARTPTKVARRIQKLIREIDAAR